MFNFLLAKIHMFFYTGKEIGYFLVTNVTTQIYARITTQKLDNDLTMLGNKLNQSFSNIKRA